jgi:hypothetical protein
VLAGEMRVRAHIPPCSDGKVAQELAEASTQV